MYTIRLRKGHVTTVIDTVKFKSKKEAEEWLKDFSKCFTERTHGKVIKCSK